MHRLRSGLGRIGIFVRSGGLTAFGLVGLVATPVPAAAQAASQQPAQAASAAEPVDYFPSLLPNLLAAPLPNRIYREGGIPAIVPQLEVDWNPLGRLGTYLPGGLVTTADNAFFQPLGNNGRSCATCHQPPSGMGLSLRNVKYRFRTTGGKDPLFAPVDGANCPSAVPAQFTAPATIGERAGSGHGELRDAYSLLLSRGTIRMPLPWPPKDPQGQPLPVEFDIHITPQEDRPGCNTDPVDGIAAGFVSVYRRPLMAAQMNFKTFRPGETGPILRGSLMWDGRERSMELQAIHATQGHAQTKRRPTDAQVAEMVDFQTSIFTAQLVGNAAGRLDADGATGGPVNLAGQAIFPGFGTTFDEYDRWRGQAGVRQSINRGQAIFNNRLFTVSRVAGFNTLPGVPAEALASCSTCHNIEHGGSDFLENPQRDIGIGGTARFIGGPKPAEALPRFTLTCHADARPHAFLGLGPIVTNDPGRALVTGKCADIGKFTIPQLRGLASREPYFHDGTAKTLADVVDFYDRRFKIGFSATEKEDLVNFLASL
jgi:cytochrome c peroxidase